MRVVPRQSGMDINPAATASSTLTGSSPANAIDANSGTVWVSSVGADPYLQIDLGRILKVYRIEIAWTSSVAGNARILSTDNTEDYAYGSYSGPFDLVREFAPQSSTTQVLNLEPAKNARHWRIQQVASLMSASIVNVTMYAASFKQNTTARVRIGYRTYTGNIVSGGTIFSEENNDLLDIDVDQSVDRAQWGGSVLLNNKAQQYTRASFPEGTPIKIWLDGVSSLLAQVVNDNPSYSGQGFTLGVDARGYDEFLNQHVRVAWAATPISDKTAVRDIISIGTDSILGRTLNSSGARVIGNANVQNAVIGANIPVYLTAKNVSKFQVLGDLAEQTFDGAWVPQNGSMPASLTTYGTTLGKSGVGTADGYWFSTQTQPGYFVSLRDTFYGSVGGLVPPYIRMKATGAIVSGGSAVDSLSNPNRTYDGGIHNDDYYNFVEVFQNVFCPVSTCSASGSFNFSAFLGTQSDLTTGGSGLFAGASQLADMIVETTDRIGRTKRLHYIVQVGMNCPITNPCTACGLIEWPPSQTQTDAYVDLTGAATGTNLCQVYASAFGATSRNLYNDYTGKFGTSSGSDVVIALRMRLLPFGKTPASGSQPNESNIDIVWDSISIAPVSHVFTPPRRFDFYVHESSSGSQVPDLFWFPRPRPGRDLAYRHLADEHSLKWFRMTPDTANSVATLASVESNNIQSLNLMKGDVYRVKNDVSLFGGQALQLKPEQTIDATTSDYINRVPGQFTHASRFQQIQIADMASITSVGRRPYTEDVAITDPNLLAREAIKISNTNRDVEQRGTLVCKGNANLQPGNVVQVKSDYSEVAGYYYIISANHKWNSDGFITTLTLDDDRFRLTSEFSRIQNNILSATGRGLEGASGQLDTIVFGKKNANLNPGIATSTHGGGAPFDKGVFSLPFNVLPEFSNVRNVKISLTKALSPENVGYTGTSAGTSPTFTQGWERLNVLSGLAYPTDDTTVTNETNVTDTRWVAQRFLTSQSAGRIMFQFRGRFPGGATLAQNQVLFSIYTDSQLANLFTPGDPIVGTVGDVDRDYAALLAPGNIFAQIPVRKAPVQGWIAIPANKFQATGENSSRPDRARFLNTVEMSMQSPQPPGSNLWLVVRLMSAGDNFWVAFADQGAAQLYPGELSENAGRGSALVVGFVDRWIRPIGAGGTIADNIMTNFRVYGQLALSSSGAYLATGYLPGVPQRETNKTIIPGVSGFQTGMGGFGERMPRPGASYNNATLITITGEGTGNGAYAIEPVTGDRYPFISQPGQHQLMSYVQLPTSFLARTDSVGDTMTSVGCAFGSAFPDNQPSRCDYTMAVDYIRF